MMPASTLYILQRLLTALLLWTQLAVIVNASIGNLHIQKRSFNTQSACVSEIPQDILHAEDVLKQKSVRAALRQVENKLKTAFSEYNPDAISLGIVHAAKSTPIYTFNHGVLRLNETKGGLARSEQTNPRVNSNSIFRINSISKNVAALSAVILRNLTASFPLAERLTWSTRLADVLPEFRLPQQDWDNGGSEITLGMLATESSGLRREGYANGFNIGLNHTRATAQNVGAFWSSVTPSEVLEFQHRKGLLWSPGERLSYSNAGFNILGYAIANYMRNHTNFVGEWGDVATNHILKPLGMKHSFFGAVPANLKHFVSVPSVPNWVDLVIHAGYDPAAGMFSSVSDLAKLVRNIYLKRTPELISAAQRRDWMQPRRAVDDGKQLVGEGWESQIIRPKGELATYVTYGKTGSGGGQYSYIDTLPPLGYGIIVLLSASKPTGGNYTTPYPLELTLELHDILAPAFRDAYNVLLNSTYGGMYRAMSTDSSNNSGGETLLTLQGDSLHVKHMNYKGIDILERIDQLSWSRNSHPRYFSQPGGPSLHPSSIRGNWHMAVDGETCDWFDFDGYTDENGDPVDGIILEKTEKGMKLTYPSLDAVFYRVA